MIRRAGNPDEFWPLVLWGGQVSSPAWGRLRGDPSSRTLCAGVLLPATALPNETGPFSVLATENRISAFPRKFSFVVHGICDRPQLDEAVGLPYSIADFGRLLRSRHRQAASRVIEAAG